MKKLLQGIVDFRQHVRPGSRELFSRLALGQKPDALMVACSDSRVAPNVFASTDPGDLFVVRNVGNLVPPVEGGSAWAAIEFAVMNLSVRDIIVCGHSECGAMQALVEGREKLMAPHLRHWLRHGEPALERMKTDPRFAALKPHNRLSQLNVLCQLDHLKSHAELARRVSEGSLALHGWWFDIGSAEVQLFDPATDRFEPIDEEHAKVLLERLR